MFLFLRPNDATTRDNGKSNATKRKFCIFRLVVISFFAHSTATKHKITYFCCVIILFYRHFNCGKTNWQKSATIILTFFKNISFLRNNVAFKYVHFKSYPLTTVDLESFLNVQYLDSPLHLTQLIQGTVSKASPSLLSDTLYRRHYNIYFLT